MSFADARPTLANAVTRPNLDTSKNLSLLA
jgi:hypothetical protein